MNLPILGLILIFSSNAFGNSTSEKIIVKNFCYLPLCPADGEQVWAIDYQQQICRVFPNSCQLGIENCNRRNRHEPELVETTQDHCQKCYPRICPKYYEPINNCTVLVKCSLQGEKVWAIDYEKKICHVFPNSCQLGIENCNRRHRCESELVATTQSQCQKCFTEIRPVPLEPVLISDLVISEPVLAFEPVLPSEKIIVPNRCMLFRCSLGGPKVWAIDYLKRTCRVFPNSCHLAIENCNRRNRCEPVLIATTQDECQECYPTICPGELIPMSGEMIVENKKCNLQFKCSVEGEKVWAIDYEQKICRVFPNSCQLASENCNRQNRCEPELTPTTQEECQQFCPRFCLEYYDPICAYFKDKQMTFSNMCDLNRYVCKTGESYMFSHNGECGILLE